MLIFTIYDIILVFFKILAISTKFDEISRETNKFRYTKTPDDFPGKIPATRNCETQFPSETTAANVKPCQHAAIKKITTDKLPINKLITDHHRCQRRMRRNSRKTPAKRGGRAQMHACPTNRMQPPPPHSTIHT